MKPRGIGRARLVIAAGALLIAFGCFLPWWSVGGIVTEQHTGNAFDSVLGVVVFGAALLLLTAMVLPYASRDRYSPFDRLSVHGLLFLLAAVAFGIRLWQINAPEFNGLGLPPVIPGAWISAAGLIVVLLGLIDLFGENQRER